MQTQRPSRPSAIANDCWGNKRRHKAPSPERAFSIPTNPTNCCLGACEWREEMLSSNINVAKKVNDFLRSCQIPERVFPAETFSASEIWYTAAGLPRKAMMERIYFPVRRERLVVSVWFKTDTAVIAQLALADVGVWEARHCSRICLPTRISFPHLDCWTWGVLYTRRPLAGFH